MPKRLPPHIGSVYGGWTVLGGPELKVYPSGKRTYVVPVECRCKFRKKIDLYYLTSGEAGSCQKCLGLRFTKNTVAIGQKIKSWTVIEERRGSSSNHYKRQFLVVCDCGAESLMTSDRLFSSRYQKCRKCSNAEKGTHRMSKTDEYRIWYNMIQRCYNKDHTLYELYGGRGVSVCDRWNPANGGSFANFYKDLGPRPSKDHQLDKEAVLAGNKIYAPGLALWATRKENCRRRSNSIFVAFNGKRISISALAEQHGVEYYKLYQKIKNMNLTPEDAIKQILAGDRIASLLSKIDEEKGFI